MVRGAGVHVQVYILINETMYQCFHSHVYNTCHSSIFRYDFIEMWDFAELAPDKLLSTSKTLTGASFGLGLSKVLPPLACFPISNATATNNYICQNNLNLHPSGYPLTSHLPNNHTQDDCERQHCRRGHNPAAPP